MNTVRTRTHPEVPAILQALCDYHSSYVLVGSIEDLLAHLTVLHRARDAAWPDAYARCEGNGSGAKVFSIPVPGIKNTLESSSSEWTLLPKTLRSP